MFNKYPYTDFHELNLDWILSKIKEMSQEMQDFIHTNEIKIGGVWDITKEYDAWTVVTNNNFGYISIKDVPAGTLIGNGEYWMMIFDYSQLFNNFETRLSAVEESTDLSDRLLDFSKRKAIVIGDSYATLTPSWVDTMNNLLDFASLDNLAVSGTGFDRGGVNGFLVQLQTYSGDKNAITDIIIAGGANDAENRTQSNFGQLRAAAVDAIQYAKQNYPNAQIHLGFIGGCLASSTYASTHTNDMFGWAIYSYKQAAEIENIHYLNNIENAIHMLLASYQGDGLHPSSTGSTILGRCIAEAIKYQFNAFQAKYPAGLTVDSTFNSISGNLNYQVDNENTQIYASQIILMSGAITLNGNVEQRIATMTTTTFNEEIEYYDYLFFNNFNSITYQYVLCKVRYYGNNISITPLSLNAGGTGYENYSSTGSSMIVLQDHMLTVPTISIN